MSSDIMYFDRNENQYGPAPDCFEVLRNTSLERMSSYTRDFTRGVKSRLSERLALHFGIDEKSVVLGYGGEDILKQVVHCYLRAGETILIPSHSWWYYKAIADEVDGIKVEYPIVEGDDTFRYDIDAMLELYREQNPSLVFISSPNNPTGNSMSPEDLRELLGEMKDAVVVLDEAYWSYASDDPAFSRNLLAEFPKLLIVRTFSKYYALAGVRIGYALMGEGLTRFAQYSARYLGYHRLSEEIALAALDSTDYYLDMSRKMEEDKVMFYRELGSLPGFTAYRSDANFVLVRIPSSMMAPLKTWLTERNMIVKFMNEELLNSHLRITIGTQKQNRLLVDAIQEYVNGQDVA